MKNFDKLTTVLILIGALNWGLIGLFDFDVFDCVLGGTWLDRLLAVLIGFSAIYKIANWQAKKSSK